MLIFTNEMLYNDDQFDDVHAYVHSKEFVMNFFMENEEWESKSTGLAWKIKIQKLTDIEIKFEDEDYILIDRYDCYKSFNCKNECKQKLSGHVSLLEPFQQLKKLKVKLNLSSD